MTPKQALAACIKIDPSRIYCAQRQDWHYSANHQRTEFELSVQPGLNGAVCHHFTCAAGFRECVEAYRAAHAAAQ